MQRHRFFIPALMFFSAILDQQEVKAQFGNTKYGEAALNSNTTGNYNTALGYNALYENTTGYNNTATGAFSLRSNTSGISNTTAGLGSMYSNTSGSYNTANGVNALRNNTSGYYNTATGIASLFNNTTGYYNTATGPYALFTNSNGHYNTASGYQALYFNTTGSSNTATGFNALTYNTTGAYNTASGLQALLKNTTGNHNSASGTFALSSNSTGSYNNADGVYSLYSNTTGISNTGVGSWNLYRNTTGSSNTGVGSNALFYNTAGNLNTGIGYFAGGSGSGYSLATLVGAHTNASTGLSNITLIGYGASATASNQVRLGNTNVTSIGGYANWTNFSDGRYKKSIKEDVPGLEFINQLRPVTYTLDVDGIERALKSNAPAAATTDDEQTLLPAPAPEDLKAKAEKAKVKYTGFLAQEVEGAAKKLNYDFSGVDAPKDGKGFYGIRYGDFVVPLVKAVQELAKKNEALEEKNKSLEQRLQKLEALLPGTTNAGNTPVNITSAFLEQNAPNPFHSNTVIRYHVPAGAAAKVVITDMKGAVVKSISVNEGYGQLTLNSNAWAAGAYNYSLWINGQQSITKQMMVSRQ